MFATVNCGYLLLSAANEFQPVMNYGGLPIEGSTVNFTCPTDLVLNGTNSTTCMGNGEWEPDPQELKCIGLYQLILYSAPTAIAITRHVVTDTVTVLLYFLLYP